MISCKNINISDITLKNSPMWNQHYLDCEDVKINNIQVFNHCNGNNDGIDIDGCRRLILSNSIIDSDDDGIVSKSTGTAPCKDITVNNCIVSSYANAIKCGTESTGGFINIVISNCIVKPSKSTSKPIIKAAKHGITGVSLEMVDGGVMDGVSVNNILIEDTECPLYIRLGNRARKYLPEAPEPALGQMRNIFISNINACNTGNFSSSITGVPSSKIENVYLDNIHFFNRGGLLAGNYRALDQQSLKSHDTTTDNLSDQYIRSFKEVPEDEKGYPQPTVWRNLPSFGLFVRHVKGMYATNVSFIPTGTEPRLPIIAVDVDDLILKNVQIGNNSSNKVNVLMNNVFKYEVDKNLRVKKEND